MINNVGIDFIDQVAIQTSNFAADKGRNAGASINVVTKSGTNRFSGSAFDTFRDESLDSAELLRAARSERQPDQGASWTSTTTAAALGGPIVKNKLFFFAGVEFKSLDRQEIAAAPDAADAGRAAGISARSSVRRRAGTDDDGIRRPADQPGDRPAFPATSSRRT